MLVIALLLGAGALVSPAQEAKQPRLLIALASFRDRPKQPDIFLYEHDGVAQGKILSKIDSVNLRSDSRPALVAGGPAGAKMCVFASEIENATSKIFAWDLVEKKLITLPTINDSTKALLHPSVPASGSLIALASWDKAGSSQRWDVQIYDVAAKKYHDKPRFNSPSADERMPAFSPCGRYLAYTTNAKDVVGRTDIRLWDMKEQEDVPLPGLNSPAMDVNPALSEGGRYIAFASDRPGGEGGRDIHLYDRTEKKLVPLPGLNSVASEQTPAITADGRFVAFVSERFPGDGERDVYLYDRASQKLLPTPGLNSKREDFDPCVIVVD